MPKPLREYVRKRNFKKTPEPGAAVPSKKSKPSKKLIFVVQEHHASHLHYDFRLEWKGVLKSWAVPKGPSLDPLQKRLAVEVEDHPLAYATFVGTIPEKQYGAGEVYRWDMGHWLPKNEPDVGLKKGRLEFELFGEKLRGEFLLIRTHSQSGTKPQWLLIKRNDAYATKDQALPVTKKKQPKLSKAKIPKTKVSPHFVAPQLAQLVTEPPDGKDWVHEIKFDGYRTQVLIQDGKVKLFTRNNLDWTDKYNPIAKILEKLPVTNANLDGEIVWQDEKGHSHFQKLQNSLKGGNLDALVFWVFDLLFLDGQDLTSLPLIARKDRLEKLIHTLGDERIRYSDHFRDVGEKMMKESCRLGLEGVVSKRVDAPYVSGRHGEWMKSKCIQRQEFVVGGFTDPEGAREGLGALLLGIYEKDRLRYVGRCGTGFDRKMLMDLTKTFKRIERKDSPFQIASPRGKGIHFVKPVKVAEISFANWTQEKLLRVPVFHGLRSDKSPKEIGIEKAATPTPKKSPTKQTNSSSSESVHISHPDRLVFPKEKITKVELADYYRSVAKWMLPHVAERPLSLLRCPGMQKCFFAKHFTPLPEHLIELPRVKEINHEEPFFTIDSVEGLAMLIQMGAIEIHPWNCHRSDMERPDQIVMDFDPDPDIDFSVVKEGALELRDMLADLDLESFVKVTGGKGLHVQFPFKPLYDWDRVKEFSRTLAREMESRHPDLYTTNIRKASRHGKIFLDYLRNGLGSTAIAPYSVRAREKSSVALPLDWKELKSLRSSNGFDLRKTLQILKKRKADPWKNYFSLRQKIKIL